MGYFDDVDEMLRYACDDIGRFNSFEFTETILGVSEYFKVLKCSDLKKIDDDQFEFDGKTFFVRCVEPIC